MKTILDYFKLNGRRALITGGAKGLGKVMATALAQAGADVAIVSRTLSECEACAEEISAATGRKAIALAADVSKLDEVEAMAAAAQKQLGAIDILINNAGINIRGPVQELKESDWDAVIDINLKSRVFSLCVLINVAGFRNNRAQLLTQVFVVIGNVFIKYCSFYTECNCTIDRSFNFLFCQKWIEQNGRPQSFIANSIQPPGSYGRTTFSANWHDSPRCRGRRITKNFFPLLPIPINRAINNSEFRI